MPRLARPSGLSVTRASGQFRTDYRPAPTSGCDRSHWQYRSPRSVRSARPASLELAVHASWSAGLRCAASIEFQCVPKLRRGSGETELLGGNLLQRAGVGAGDAEVARGLLVGAERLGVPAGDDPEHDEGIQVGAVFAGVQIIIPPEIHRVARPRWIVGTG